MSFGNFKSIYNDLEKGTKESYEIATNKVLLDLYQDERIVLNRGNYDSLRKQLEDNAELETSALSFLKFAENSIFNPQGVGLEQLINARKTLNSFIKDTKDSNTKSYLKSIVENHLHKEINNGINRIFERNPHFYQQAINLYNNSLSDYATMKQTLKSLKKLGFLDEAKSNEVLSDRFIKYIEGDGGLESKDNFLELTKGLSEQNKQAIELNVLNRIYQRNLLKDNGIEVFASKNFLRETSKLKEVFNSKGAKEFIELMEGFNKLFGNDAEIALKMGYATPKVEGSSIATTLQGAAQQKMIKGIFGILMRNLPHNAVILKGLGLSENVQGQALRYHLKKALENTNDIHAFKMHLSVNAEKQNFNSATMQVLKEILSEVDTLKSEMLRDIQANLKESNETEVASTTKDRIKQARELGLNPKEAVEFINDSDSIFTKAKAYKKEQARIKEEREAKELELQKQKEAEISQNLENANAIKEIQAGLSANERALEIKEAIPMQKIEGFKSSVALNEKIIPLDLIKVKAKDLKPNFENQATQGRTQKQESVIQEIAQNFQAQKILGRGGFEDLPIITQDGQIISGNHRVQGMQNFTQESRTSYKQAIKEHFNIDLADDELLVRIPNAPLSKQELINLAFASNKETLTSLGDKAITSLGKYAKELGSLPRYIPSENVEDLALSVARKLDKSAYPDVESANLALLSNLAKNSNGENIASVLNSIDFLNLEDIAKLKDMFIKNAGEFHNLVNNLKEYGLNALEIRPYLLDSIFSTANGVRKSRDENFKELAQEITSLLKTTNTQGTNALIQENKAIYGNTLSKALGYALARFVRLENPSASLYEVLKNTKQDLEELVAPTLFSEGKPLKEADIYDFIENLIKQGETTENSSKVVELLPLLREKEKAFKENLNVKESNQTEVASTTKDRIKQARELGLNPKEAVEFIKNPPKLRENTTPQNREIIEAEIVEPQEIPYLQKELIEWIEQRPHLIAPNQEARLSTRDLIDFAKEMALPPKQAVYLINNTPRNLPIKASEAKLSYTDTKGQTHQIPEAIAQQWLKTFNLKNLQESYTPKFSDEVKQALEPILQGEQIALSTNSLIKLIQRNRLEFLPYIKETLEHSDVIIKDKENAIIFVKDIGQTSYFTSVSKNNNGKWIISTNSYKTINQLKNRTSDNGEVLYISKKAPNILAEAFTKRAFSNELTKNIIPQKTTKEIIQEAKESGKSVKQTREKIDENKLYNDLNESLKEGWDFFKANNKDEYNDKLFNNVIRVANALDVRFWYQPNAVYMNGSYTYTLNRIMLKSKMQTGYNAKTILHELIHGVTSRALYAYDDKTLRQKLSKEQIEGIDELKNLFKEVLEKNKDREWKKIANFKAELEKNKDTNALYGLRDEHEFLAELANVKFRDFLKEQNLFAKIVKAMAKIFSYIKDKLSGEVKSINAKDELESILYKIMDNYNNPHEFSTQMSEYFGSRNFVDTKRFKDYIKDNKERFDKDNQGGKYIFSYYSGLDNGVQRQAFQGREQYTKTALDDSSFWSDNMYLQSLREQKTYNNEPLTQEEEKDLQDFIDKSYFSKLKYAVERYYEVSYNGFNNAFNGAFKDKHFFEAKKGERVDSFKYDLSSDAKLLMALKPYFESGLYKTLDENDFKRISENITRILKDESLKYRNKPINEWLAKEWAENDVKNLLQEPQIKPFEKLEQDSTSEVKMQVIDFNAPMKQIKSQMLEALKPIFNQTLTSSDGIQAYMSLKSLSKMTSDKAVQKSIDNGFSREEHLQAVLDIQRLFENAKLQATEPHKSGEKNAIIHRLNSELENGNALITTKESLDINKNRIYSLELELIPRFNDSSTPLNTKISEGGFNSQKGHQEQTIKAEPSIAKTDMEIIPQKTTKEIIKEAKESGKSVAETKKLIAQNKEIQKEILPLETIQLNTLKNIKSYANLVGLPLDTKGAKAFKNYLQTRLKDIEC